MRAFVCCLIVLCAAPVAGQDLDELLKREAFDPVEGALAAARLVEPRVDPVPVRAALDEAAAELKVKLAAAQTDGERADALASAVHRVLRVAVEQDPQREHEPAAVLPHRVLANRKGACLGLSLIYLGLAHRTGLPLRGVSAPGHFFVRLGELNLETTLEGLPRSEAWLRQRTGLDAEGRPGNYLRDLTPREVVAEVLNNLGGALVRGGEPKRALPLLRRARELSPDAPGVAYNLAVALRASGRSEAARAPLERALQLHASKEALNLRGLMALDADRPDRAVKDFSACIARDPDEARYWNNRGAARCRMGLLEAGLADLDRALTLRPGWAEAHLNRGLARLEGGALEGAAFDLRAAKVTRWREVFRRVPETAAGGRSLVQLARSLDGAAARAALFAGGDRLLEAGRASDAKAAFNRVLNLGGARVEAYCKRGLACEKLGDELWAKRNYYLATQADPADPMGYRYFGYYYLRRDKYAIAVDYFQNYLRRAPRDAPDRVEVSALVREIRKALKGQ